MSRKSGRLGIGGGLVLEKRGYGDENRLTHSVPESKLQEYDLQKEAQGKASGCSIESRVLKEEAVGERPPASRQNRMNFRISGAGRRIPQWGGERSSRIRHRDSVGRACRTYPHIRVRQEGAPVGHCSRIPPRSSPRTSPQRAMTHRLPAAG